MGRRKKSKARTSGPNLSRRRFCGIAIQTLSVLGSLAGIFSWFGLEPPRRRATMTLDETQTALDAGSAQLKADVDAVDAAPRVGQRPE
jgi:hypothetical protein